MVIAYAILALFFQAAQAPVAHSNTAAVAKYIKWSQVIIASSQT